MADVERAYSELADVIGKPGERQPMPDEELAFCEQRLPGRLVRFLRESGYATYQLGGVTVCKPSTLAPILALVFKADGELDHRDCTAVSYNPFGDISIWSQRHGTIMISLAEGTIFSQTLAPTQFRPEVLPPAREPTPSDDFASYATVLHFEDDFDFLDYQGDGMLARCIAMHGPIALGECYGFFPALALAGVESPMRRVENIRRVPALEHFAFLAQAQPFYLTKVGPTGVEKVRQIG